MQKKEFKAESKRLMDLMINSIYTQKEIFLRELISNASDAIDKLYYKALTDSEINFNREDFFIRLTADKENRQLTLADTGIGMSKEELENNLGTIAKSGSFDFKKQAEANSEIDIIGQFGVGFYSSFMVSEKVTVISKKYGSDTAYKWESDGSDGYTVSEAEKDAPGTEIILKIKQNTEDEDYDEYLEEYRLRSLVKKYSDFIRYPIKMLVSKSRLKEGSEKEYESYTEDETLNSMVPIWRKNKSELTKDDYIKFYTDKHYGFDEPLKYVHINAEGTVSYRAILYIPKSAPFDFYTKDFQRGLELYSSGVMIMNKCADLLPDYFGFVQGLVDSENLSLNISRELLQHDRQLQFIAKKLKDKIKSELETMLREQREDYEQFYNSFGRTLKYGIYSGYGSNKEILQDLLMFRSSKEKKLVTFAEYVSRMAEGQKYIYYASGENADKIAKLPQAEVITDKGYEILFFTDDVDEFAVKMMQSYQEKEFKSISDADLGIEDTESSKDKEKETENKELFAAIKDILKDKVKDVKASYRLKSHPVCLSTQGGLSIEMEKVLKTMPNAGDQINAEKVLEINESHEIMTALKAAFQTDKEKLALYANLLYNQALLIEGLPVSDPVDFSNDICKLMK